MSTGPRTPEGLERCRAAGFFRSRGLSDSFFGDRDRPAPPVRQLVNGIEDNALVPGVFLSEFIVGVSVGNNPLRPEAASATVLTVKGSLMPRQKAERTATRDARGCVASPKTAGPGFLITVFADYLGALQTPPHIPVSVRKALHIVR
jgi:hypothetical protein